MSEKPNTDTPRWVFMPFVAACLVIAVAAQLQWLDRRYPPDLSKLNKLSFVVEDRRGKLLRAFAADDGRWRLSVDIKDVDPRFIKMLLAYEDKRFFSHVGVDPVAMVRAAGQLLRHGRIVSGGSTLTMQVARLLQGPAKRGVATKLRQMARAVQIERRLSKRQILRVYLELAPYGGNLEGIRAASLAYFGKEPKNLTAGQAALLVALPQSPEARRPDRFRSRAQQARNRVLARMVSQGVISAAEGKRAGAFALTARRRALPALAAHLAQKLRNQKGAISGQRLTIDKALQARLEALARERASELGKKASLAIVVADHASGEIVAQVSSPDFFNGKRLGQVDMASALRSPGSTLKPFIYGLAFEAGIVHPASFIEDAPQSFSSYRPRNFDLSYQGTVSVEKALQLSLNIPAIRLLASVGPQRLLARFRRSGVHVKLPKNKTAGLAIGLGGVGISLRDLVQLYTALPRGGVAVGLSDGVKETEKPALQRCLGKVPSWYVQHILSGVRSPEGAHNDANIAYKTGTSYGHRDAWSIGFDGRYVVGVWVGRPDGTPVPGITGITHAAPLLFDAFVRVSETVQPLEGPPAGALLQRNAQLPQILRRFTPRGEIVSVARSNGKAPQIVYPPMGAKIDLGFAGKKDVMPLFVKMDGGKQPFRWLANGKPLKIKTLRRQLQWLPDSRGFSTLTVLDALGRAASVRVFVE